MHTSFYRGVITMLQSYLFHNWYGYHINALCDRHCFSTTILNIIFTLFYNIYFSGGFTYSFFLLSSPSCGLGPKPSQILHPSQTLSSVHVCHLTSSSSSSNSSSHVFACA
ncbi:hypothetical protein EGW08_016777 [Elysia chlorotica]|uniref:Uncharacterized protein n=1 Tax=Elysia chlorotica TaxID=188477 RepID=A0A433T1P6_ELYCH|nr:hypothetical protein EGW08_016777 [Elysia chlorotica]